MVVRKVPWGGRVGEGKGGVRTRREGQLGEVAQRRERQAPALLDLGRQQVEVVRDGADVVGRVDLGGDLGEGRGGPNGGGKRRDEE